VVAAQIHDAEDDDVEIRLEGRELIAQYNDGGTDVTIDPAYSLGTLYDLSITAANSRIEVHYNGRLAAEIPVAGDGWYFKAGSYVQSNPQRGDAPDASARWSSTRWAWNTACDHLSGSHGGSQTSSGPKGCALILEMRRTASAVR
jgi:hypothetical protein